tara:strand:+ start:1646 stop:1882 length:237 start_codon:yes stop_codon:yes gene_type:complete
MKLEILTPEEKLFTGDVYSVQVPGSNGRFQMLNKHAPIVSSLKKGTVKIIDDKKKEFLIEVNTGIIEMKNNKIIILSE